VTARRAAAEILVAVLERRRALDAALDDTESFSALEGRDRGFARAIVAAALRRLGRIDAVLAQFLDRPLPDTASFARALLRSGAAQLLVLGTPAHAAVSETVDVANAARAGRPFAKLINAVLRKVADKGPALFDALPVAADLPAWLVTRWRAAYGAETAARIAAALGEEPPLDICVKADAPDWAERLGGALLPTGAVRIAAPASVEKLAGFDEGAWWVQDAAAALPALAFGDVRGKTMLDLCAAPGGKTLQLAAAGARVTALDRSAERLETLGRNLARTRLEAEVICTDALTYRPVAPFDGVLLDAPCTSTGTLRRHPDIAWLRRPDDVRKLAHLQAKLLDAAAAMLKPGGTLVYAVCSLEPEEGPAIVQHALSQAVWSRQPIRAGEIPGADEFVTPDGDLRTLPAHWPEQGGLDGFYAARLVRH
jgi:16S rRNA (cytosine967-C5)-methyltransferase